MTLFDLQFLKGGKQTLESEALLERSEGGLRIVLDERGEQIGSRGLASRISRWEQSPGVKEVCFLIGGAEGHADCLRQRADWLWSLSALTLQHELALLVVLEQIYRAHSIKAGGPYHRD
jgi:23S rRNA (pseudouridine1915-N3)-methyltransferase